MTLILVALAAAIPAPGAAAVDAVPAVGIGPADYEDEAKLADLLWGQSPEVLEARTLAGIAASEVVRARTLPNPSLDFTWGTIPIGRTNPPDLHDPLGNVPNYSSGISELIEVAKRGPRQAAVVAELEKARAQTLVTLAGRFFELLHAVGHMAKSQYRAGVMSELVNASEKILELDRARVAKGDMATMDLERAETEHVRLVIARDAAVSELEDARASCAMVAMMPCAPFPSGHLARLFMEKATTAVPPTPWSDEIEQRRPDLAALGATLRAAEQRETLARRRVIPDVTVRVGYTYDQFLVSGNQEQSLALGLQIPLPVMDSGRADRQAAAATLVHAARTRQSLIESGRATLEAAAHQRELVAARIQQIERAVAKARAVRDAVQGASQRGAMSLSDVLLAQRAYRELSLERIDLDGEAYDATLKVRQVAALFPSPRNEPEAYTQ